MDQIQYIIGDENRLKHMSKVHAWKPFDERAVAFCSKLSEALKQIEDKANYPDLVTLMFWLRKSNIKKIAQEYDKVSERLGKGLVFHIAPGNVALSFAYSLATGLLTGNTNIIRMPSRQFEQAEIFCEMLCRLEAEEPEIAQRVCLIKYSHNKEITDEISSRCHVRVIWGGDSTINTIRKSPIPARANEITFADRFSVCLIDSERYLEDYNAKKTAHDFYIDTFLSDQNACSSPRIIFWLGGRREEAKRVFWSALHNEISHYEMASVTTVDKLLTFCKYAAKNRCELKYESDLRIMRIAVDSLTDDILDNIGNSGFFYECDILNIEEILPICTWKLQTLSYIGLNEINLRDMVLTNAPEGVDRIVPVGHTMDFGLIWDGRDIVKEMTREIRFQ